MDDTAEVAPAFLRCGAGVRNLDYPSDDQLAYQQVTDSLGRRALPELNPFASAAAGDCSIHRKVPSLSAHETIIYSLTYYALNQESIESAQWAKR